MKRAYLLLLALALLLTGCGGKGKRNNVSVKDVCCPYEINHVDDDVELILQDGGKSGILWQVEMIPEDVCQVVQGNTGKEDTWRYRISGQEEGAAQLTFTAIDPEEVVVFTLSFVVDVNAKGKTVLSSYQHHERKVIAVDAEGLNYRWNVDMDGILHFSFINADDSWSPRAEAEEVCLFSDMLSTPSGCKFSAEAKASGQATVVLSGENTGRTIHVVIRADEEGKMEILSVREQ